MAESPVRFRFVTDAGGRSLSRERAVSMYDARNLPPVVSSGADWPAVKSRKESPNASYRVRAKSCTEALPLNVAKKSPLPKKNDPESMRIGFDAVSRAASSSP